MRKLVRSIYEVLKGTTLNTAKNRSATEHKPNLYHKKSETGFYVLLCRFWYCIGTNSISHCWHMFSLQEYYYYYHSYLTVVNAAVFWLYDGHTIVRYSDK